MSVVLCKDNAFATHIVAFQTIYGNKFSVLTDTPFDTGKILEDAEIYIWAYGLENSVSGYYVFSPSEAEGATEEEDSAYIRMQAGFFENCLRDCVNIYVITRKQLAEYLAEHHNVNINVSTDTLPADITTAHERVKGYAASCNGSIIGVYASEGEAIEALIEYLAG